MPTILRISPDDQYDVEDMGFFTLTTFTTQGNTRFRVSNRDLYRDISKNSKPVLQMLARECHVLGYQRMRKQDLIDNLAGLIVFEQPDAQNNE